MNKDLVIVGCGGHAASVLDCILRQNIWRVKAIVGREDEKGKDLCGLSVQYTDGDLAFLFAQGIQQAVIAVGGVQDHQVRKRLSVLAKEIGFSFANIFDPSAVLAEGVTLGEGIFIGKNAVVNQGALIADMAIVNTGAIIEHGCKVGEYTHIAPGAVLCGDVTVGRETLIGTNATVINGVSVGNGCTVGAGSVVLHDIPEHQIAYGNPCKVKK